jgi:hypothetical protein
MELYIHVFFLRSSARTGSREFHSLSGVPSVREAESNWTALVWLEPGWFAVEVAAFALAASRRRRDAVAQSAANSFVLVVGQSAVLYGLSVHLPWRLEGILATGAAE